MLYRHSILSGIPWGEIPIELFEGLSQKNSGFSAVPHFYRYLIQRYAAMVHLSPESVRWQSICAE